VKITGLDLKEEVIGFCNETAKKLNYENLNFVYGDISDFEVIVVEQGRDSVDYKIVQIFQQGDILITQDYGLASLLLGKASAIIHTAGFFINKNNIDSLLQSRYISDKIRKQGGKSKGPSKRRKEQDENFKKCLYKVLREYMSNKKGR
jgi:uncharacterized protein YaiI (UPF0178 family)